MQGSTSVLADGPHIDTQVHLIDPLRYPFPDRQAGYLPKSDETGSLEALIETLDADGIEQAVLVPASVYGTDNRILCDAVHQHPGRLRTIVTIAEQADVDSFNAMPGIVGARLNLVDGRTNREDIVALARLIVDADLILQIQAAPSQLIGLIETLDRPDANVVLDHFGRVDLAHTKADFEALLALAKRPNIHLKASAQFRLLAAPIEDISDRQGQRNILEAFGKDRILWGSDWPFINFDGTKPTYCETLGTITDLMGEDWQKAADTNAQALFGWSDE